MSQSRDTIALWPIETPQSPPLPASAWLITQLGKQASQQQACVELECQAGTKQARAGRARELPRSPSSVQQCWLSTLRNTWPGCWKAADKLVPCDWHPMASPTRAGCRYKAGAQEPRSGVCMVTLTWQREKATPRVELHRRRMLSPLDRMRENTCRMAEQLQIVKNQARVSSVRNNARQAVLSSCSIDRSPTYMQRCRQDVL